MSHRRVRCSRRIRRWSCGIALAGLLVDPAAGASPDASVAWERRALPAGLERATAVALVVPTDASQAAAWAIGGDRGVAVGGRGMEVAQAGPAGRVLSRGPVRFLHFDAATPALWIAGATGLLRADGSTIRTERVGTGEAARVVHAIDTQGDRLAVATDAGVFWRPTPDAAWRLLQALPSGAVTRAIWDARGAGIWARVEGALWWGGTDGTRRRVVWSGVAEGAGVLDISRNASGEPLVLWSRAIAERVAGRWRHVPLDLPPGTQPAWLRASAGRYWLATDAGLLSSAQLDGPWLRARAPLGHVAVSGLAAAGDRVLVALRYGVWLGRVGEEESPRVGPGPAAVRVELQRVGLPSSDPPIRAVQRRALRYAGLEPDHLASLRRAAMQRAWLPEVRLRLGHGRDRDRLRDHDEAYLSSGRRTLIDRERRSGEGSDASLELSWDLAGLVYEPESLDVSREARLVIQLRDDVLDEVNQLYFERQALLGELVRGAAEDPARVRLRAAALAAALDAWTGGWFSSTSIPGVAPDRDSGPAHPAQEDLP
ncbi:MAG: hypothetical protein AAF430_19905 [Myxococcota bacterium]